MPTRAELNQQIADAKKAGEDAHALIEQGRQAQHDATARQNELNQQLAQLDKEEATAEQKPQ